MEEFKMDNPINMKFWGACAFLFVAVTSGVWVGSSSWGGRIELSKMAQDAGSSRNPATIRSDLDFSSLVGAELLLATQRRLVSEAKILRQNLDVGIELGAFVTRGEDGERLHVCQHYDRISMIFEAEGIAVSGRKAGMEIDGPCTPSQDISRIEPIWIPVSRLLEQPPTDMDISFDNDVDFRFERMVSEWPPMWRLVGVKLYSSNDLTRGLSLSGEELRQHLTEALILDWRPDASRRQ
jgi:hypothetical protein